jgi:hypothetical protein
MGMQLIACPFLGGMAIIKPLEVSYEHEGFLKVLEDFSG